MTRESEALFRELAPPPGGAARMRTRLRDETGHSARPASAARAAWVAGAVAVVASIVAVFVVLHTSLAPDTARQPAPESLYAAAAFDRLLGRESTPYALHVSRGKERLGFRELASSDPNIRLVEIEPASSGDSPEDTEP
jgi:hypothetical protein